MTGARTLRKKKMTGAGTGVERSRAMRVMLTAAVVLLSAGIGWAQHPGDAGAEQYFRIEWTVGSGGGVVSGYVYNSRGLRARNVWLSIQGDDASGSVVSTTSHYVGEIPADNRSYFEASVPAGAVAYRVRVLLFDWFTR